MAIDLVPYPSSSSSNRKSPNIPWLEMFRSASSHHSSPPYNPNHSPNQGNPPHPPPPSSSSKTLTLDPQSKLALYITMVHATLALIVFIMYYLYRLLYSFICPLQWVLLCFIPLRQLYGSLYSF